MHYLEGSPGAGRPFLVVGASPVSTKVRIG